MFIVYVGCEGLFITKCGAQLVCISTGCLACSLALPMQARVFGCCCPTLQNLYPRAPYQIHLLLTQNHACSPFSPAPSPTLHIVYHPLVLTCQQPNDAKKTLKVYQVTAVSCLCVTFFFVCILYKKNDPIYQGVLSMNSLYVSGHMLWWYLNVCFLWVSIACSQEV